MKIVTVKCDSTMVELDWDSRVSLNEYYGDEITFVGQISSNIVAIGKKNNSGESENKFVQKYHNMFEEDIRGEILLVGTNDDGSELDLNIENITKQLEILNDQQAKSFVDIPY